MRGECEVREKAVLLFVLDSEKKRHKKIFTIHLIHRNHTLIYIELSKNIEDPTIFLIMIMIWFSSCYCCIVVMVAYVDKDPATIIVNELPKKNLKTMKTERRNKREHQYYPTVRIISIL